MNCYFLKGFEKYNFLPVVLELVNIPFMNAS